VGDLAQAVLDQQDGGSLLLVQALEHLDDLAGGLHVQAGGRLVQDQHARPHRQHCADGHALDLPAGKRVQAAPEQMGEAERLSDRGHAGADSLLIQPQIARAAGQLLIHGQVEELGSRVLEDDADLLGDLRRGEQQRVAAVYLDCAGQGHAFLAA